MSKRRAVASLVGISLLAAFWLLDETREDHSGVSSSIQPTAKKQPIETSEVPTQKPRPSPTLSPQTAIREPTPDAEEVIVQDPEKRDALAYELRTTARDLKDLEAGFLEGKTSQESFERYNELQRRYYETARRLRPPRKPSTETIARQQEFFEIARDWNGTERELSKFKIKFMNDYVHEKKGGENEEL